MEHGPERGRFFLYFFGVENGTRSAIVSPKGGSSERTQRGSDVSCYTGACAQLATLDATRMN